MQRNQCRFRSEWSGYWETVRLPDPPTTRPGITDWVSKHLGHLTCDRPAASPAFVGGQRAADHALAELDIGGYAHRRSMVDPPSTRGASKLSPYIRHGLLDLTTVWNRVEDAPDYDRFRYQGELLWQEHARHWYALVGRASRSPVSHLPPRAQAAWPAEPWWSEMRCIDATLDELHRDGWAVNQTRMWLAGQYSLRGHGDPAQGEDQMFRHLLDGSRAANRMGWQWSAGTSRSRACNFARRQVMKRAPRYCEECSLRYDCPIRAYAKAEPRQRVAPPELQSLKQAFGPRRSPTSAEAPDAVWLTAESLGANDPAMRSHPDAPVLFVFDEPLLQRLRLSGKRLIFLAETLAELRESREVQLHLGRPADVLGDFSVAATFAPVPGFASRVNSARALLIEPWPWLRPLTDRYATALARSGSFPAFKEWCQLTKPSR